MARRSLRPHLNQIRTWVRQGRTDAWIAHQLEVTVQQITSFKREQSLEADGENGAEAPAAGADFDRSEEHTSELQSRQYLVCRLLLEKKKKITTRFTI